jgi:hypothetical protein
MDESSQQPPNDMLEDGVLEFRSTRKIALQVTLALAGSLLTIVMMGVFFFLTVLLNNPKPGMMPGLIGGMGVVPVMGISFSIYMLKRPVRVILEPQGLTIEWLVGRKSFSWDDIARIEPGEVSGLWQNWMGSLSSKKNVPKECLRLFDRDGRKVAEFDNDIESFAELSREIYSRSSISQGVSTFDMEEHTARQIKKQKKNRLAMIFIGLFMVTGGIAFGITTFVGEHNKRQLEEHGQIVQAIVSRHFIYNITPRIEYTFTAADGQTYSKDVIVERDYWEGLEENGAVDVKYLPSNPKRSRLVFGQVEINELPFSLGVVMSLFLTGLGLFCTGMYFLGISDIKFEDGKFRIVRIGQIEQSAVTAALTETIDDTQPGREPTSEDIEVEPDIPYAVSMPAETLTADESRLPAGLKAIGILNIVFGGIGVLWNGFRIILVCLLGSVPIRPFEGVEFTGDLFWAIASHSIGILIGLLLLISGCGILAFRNWGRILAMVSALGKIVHGTTGLILMYMGDFEMPDSEKQFVFNTTRIFIVFCILLTMIYPVLLLVLLQRRSIREVFREAKQRDEQADGLMYG